MPAVFNLAEFLASLDRHPRRVPLPELVRRLEELDMDLEEVGDYVRFSPDHYQRNLMHAGRGFHALILCWRSGQRSPIHDHRGSSCGVRILKGTVTETLFERTAGGLVYPTRTRELAAGSVCGSQDGDIHQVSNLQPPGHDLITLHVYSPPLLVMGTYSLTDASVGEFVDPILEFCHGGGI